MATLQYTTFAGYLVRVSFSTYNHRLTHHRNHNHGMISGPILPLDA